MRMFRPFLFAVSLALLPAMLPGVVEACPLCKAANESDQDGEVNTKPRAYMYSILFMLAMPATLLGSYGAIFYRISRSAAADDVAPPDSPV